MSVETHPAYSEEQERLVWTQGQLTQELELLAQRERVLDDRVESTKRGSGSGFDIDWHLAQTTRDYTREDLAHLRQLRQQAYFARVDFAEANKEVAERLYFGKFGFNPVDGRDPIVIDWRAPIANIYYSVEAGSAGYRSPDGERRGQVHLKRHLEVDGHEIRRITDAGALVAGPVGSKEDGKMVRDEYLLSKLGGTADDRLKDVVATIQQEQNEIIRAGVDKVLIVQGVAGSGKTTVALHRLAYLVYEHRGRLAPEKMVVIAPNPLFLDYISTVLPELGAEKVQQTTWPDLAKRLLRLDVKLTDTAHRSELFFQAGINEELQARRQEVATVARFKGTLSFRRVIERYLELLTQNTVPPIDLMLGKDVVVPCSEVKQRFLEDLSYLPLAKRRTELERILTKAMNRKVEQAIEEEKIATTRRLDWLTLHPEDIGRGSGRMKLLNERDDRIREIGDSAERVIRQYFQKWPDLEVVGTYQKLAGSVELLKGLGPEELPEVLELVATHSQAVFANGDVEEEDLAALVLVRRSLYGLSEERFDHCVVDEAQDLNELELSVLRDVTREGSLTIVGDLAQGIHAYRGIPGWDAVISEVFGVEHSTRLTLRQSYRTTMEIMAFANAVLHPWSPAGCPPAEPLLRSGRPPRVMNCRNAHQLAQRIAQEISERQAEGRKSIAVIVKSETEGAKLATALKRAGVANLHRVQADDRLFRTGVLLIPAYLTKGLEFDVGIIANADAECYGSNELDARLFYVCLTRPLHELLICYQGKPSPLLEPVEQNLYQIQ